MNQPRDAYPGNRRSVAHSTGRSTYGGSRRRTNNNNNSRGQKKEGNPIGNWIQNRRQRRLRRQRSSNGGAVGTEANAIENMRKNAIHFNYPQDGFITPIEHSLLYAMIQYPERYPESVVKNEIEEEDFGDYLYANDKRKGGPSRSSGNNNEGSNREQQNNSENSEEEGGEDDEDAAASTSQSQEEAIVSYAQISALAALSAEKNPAKASKDQNTPAALKKETPINLSRNMGSPTNNASNNNNNNSNSTPNNNHDSNSNAKIEPDLSIGQALVRKLLRTITRYSDAHSLDRETEIREFLSPIERRCQLRNEKAALQQLLPAYAGYTLSLMTGNPLPLLIGAVALTGPDPMMEENNNVSTFRAVGGRAGDMETAGLLDECESD